MDIDVLIVDLPLMAKRFEALPERAKIVLLGNKDKLALVEADIVLSDIYAAAM
ncbi:MAG: exodeoxyribonuclease V alpha subunit [Paraglaciecola sp.]|jgi:exodeoxyribonuclease V alpha subunit